MGICQEKICIVDVLKEHAVEIDCLKFNIRKLIVLFRILQRIIHFYLNRMCDSIQLYSKYRIRSNNAFI